MQEILQLINGMSPYLLLGFLLAGLMHAFVPGKFYSRYLSRKSFRSVLNAALLGIPLPLCSCGVIPTAMSLRKEGASKGAVVSFLIATPQTGVDSIMATLSLMGWPFAILRPIAALVTAVLGGAVVDKVDTQVDEPELVADNAHVSGHSCCCHSEQPRDTGHCCSGHEKGEDNCCCSRPAPSHKDGDCCCGGSTGHVAANASGKGFGSRFAAALSYAYVDMMADIGKWLIIGLLVAGLITVFVPTEFFTIFRGNTFASMLLVLCIAMPMYLCATGSIPIAVALMMKGLTPGAALVMLMAGPACNFASMLVIRKTLGMRILLVYMALIVFGAISFGCLIDWLQFSGHMDFLQRLVVTGSCHVKSTSLFEWMCTTFLALMLVNALLLPKLGLRKKKQCCCSH